MDIRTLILTAGAALALAAPAAQGMPLDAPSSGFDRRYVGIGLGSASALLLLLGGSLAVTNRRHSAPDAG